MKLIPKIFTLVLVPLAVWAKTPTPELAATVLLREIRYDGRLSETQARFTVDLDFEVAGRGEASLPLFEGDVAVLPTTKLPAGLRLAREGKLYRLTASRPGRYKFRLDVVAKITRVEPWNQISFVGPAAGIGSVTAESPGADTDLQLLNGTLLATEQKDTTTRLRGYLGPERVVSLRWQTKAVEAKRKPVATCATTVTTRITPAVIKFTTQFHYEIAQGKLAKLTATLPAGHTLLRLQGEQIRDWQVKPEGDHQTLTVELIKPVETSYNLTLFSEQSVESTPFAGRLSPPQPLEVERETGTFTIAAEDVLIETSATDNVRQVNAPAGTLLAYEFYGRPFALGVNLRRVEPVVSVADRVLTRLEESRVLVTHELTLNVEKAGLYSLDLSPLGDFVVTEVRGDGIEDWRTPDGRLVVNFSSRVLGKRALTVQLEEAFKSAAKPASADKPVPSALATPPSPSPAEGTRLTAFPTKIVVSPLRVAGAAKETAVIGAAAAPGIRLKTAELVGLREIPVTSLVGRSDEMLAYAAEPADWKLTLATERLDSFVVADIFNLVTIGDGLLGGSATIRYAILNQGIQEFRVRVPVEWKNVEFTGANIRRRDHADDVWTIGLQEKAWGGYTLVVTYDQQFDPHKATLPVGGIHALGVERETGSVAISSAANLQLQPKPVADPLRRIDEFELAEADRALVTRPVLLAYRYADAKYDLAVDVTRFDESEVLQAVADRTQLTTVLTDEGQMLTQVSLMVKNSAKQFLRFKLPADADSRPELWSCYVDNLPVKAEKDGDSYLVPLRRSANRDQPFAVEILYKQKIASLKSLLPRSVALVAPETDVQTTFAEWELYVPLTHRLASFGGNMIVARGTTYGLRDAWKQFVEFYRDKFLDATRLLFVLALIAAVGALIITAIRRHWIGALTIVSGFVIVVMLAGMMLPALNQAREKARRNNELANLKQIGLLIAMFADKNNDQCPPALSNLFGEYIATDKIFYDPSSGQRIEYVGAGKKWQDANDEVLAFSPTDHAGQGRNVLFNDGRVEFMNNERFAAVLQPRDGSGMALNAAGQPAPPVTRPPAAPLSASMLADVFATPAQGAMFGAGGGAMLPVVAGIRPIRVEIPRIGQRFVFTKVLNVRGEPLSISTLAMEGKVFRVARGSVQLAAFLAGLALVWWQLRRPLPSSLLLTGGLALVIASVVNVLIATRTLHVALILGLPALVIAGVVWVARRIWKRRVAPDVLGGEAAGTAASAPDIPPVVAAIAVMLIAASSVNADVGARHASPLPDTTSIQSAIYTGTVHERVAEVDAQILLSATTSGETVRLFGEEVAVVDFSASPSNVKLLRDGKSVSIRLAHPGRATLRLKFLVKLGGDITKRQLVFNIPSALSSQVSLILDEPEAAVEVPTAVSFKSAADPAKAGQTRVEAVLGAADRVELRWTPRVKRAADIAAAVVCQNATRVRFGGGAVNARSVLDYQITQGELRTTRVRLPKGQRLLRVEGDLIRNWTVQEQGSEQILSVELMKGVSPAYRLTVETEKPLGSPPTDVTVEIVRAMDVTRETGWVGLSATEEVSLEVDKAGEMQKVDVEEFTRVVGGVGTETATAAYRFLKPEFALVVHAESVQPEIEAVVRNHMRIAEDQITVTANVYYSIERAGVFALRLALPDGYRVESVEGAPVSQWLVNKEGDRQVLEVTLKQRTIGAPSLRVQLVRFGSGLPKDVEVVGVHPLGTDKQTGYVVVSTEPGVQVKPETFDGLTEIPLSQAGVPDAAAGALAYKFIVSDDAAKRAPWNLTVATESVEPWVRAEVVNWLSLSETLISGRSVVRYEIANAPVREFVLKVPAAFRNVEISGADIRRRDQDGDRWRVELQSKVMGSYTLTVTWEQPWSAKEKGFEAVGVETVGAERETGALAVAAPATLEITAAPSSDLLKAEPRELPEWAGQAVDTTVLAYRYLRPGYQLKLQAKRFEDAAALQAMVDNARLTTVVADDGQMMTELALAVKNNARQHLEITLPEGAQVWSAFVAGRAVRPSLREGRLLLPLERSGFDDAPVTVELIYVSKERFPKNRGSVSLASPSVDVPMKNAHWIVYLPPDYRYERFEGTMSYEAPVSPVYQAFTLGDYARSETQKIGEWKTEIFSNLRRAGKALGGKQLKEASEAYSQARAIGGEGDEETRELKKLEADLRQAQASNLVSAEEAYHKDQGGNLLYNDGRVDFKSKLTATVAEQQWTKLQQAQEIAETHVTPLRVNLPTRGLRHSFSQVLQIEVGTPMKIGFTAINTGWTSWPARIGLSAGGFVLLWGVVAGALGRRQRA